MNQLANTDVTQGAGIIIIMCMIVLGIVLFRQRMDLIFGLVLRFVCGVVGIYLMNSLMQNVLAEATIGMNPTTLLTTTILGIPGLAALYGIKIMSVL